MRAQKAPCWRGEEEAEKQDESENKYQDGAGTVLENSEQVRDAENCLTPVELST